MNEYTIEERPIHVTLFAVYNDKRDLVAAFPTLDAAEMFIEDLGLGYIGGY